MLTPLNDRVIIKRAQQEEKSAGGIHLGVADKLDTTTGLVLASANDSLEVGDTVLFSKYAGMEFTVAGEVVWIMKYEELIAKI